MLDEPAAYNKRWWIDRWTYVLYKSSDQTVKFCDTLLYHHPRLTISWEQFTNLHDVLSHLLVFTSHRQRCRWDLGGGLWLEFRGDASVRLNVHQRRRRSNRQLYFHFTSASWQKYFNQIHYHILHYHRRHGRRRQQQRRRWRSISERPSYRQRHVRYGSGQSNRSVRSLSSSDNNSDRLQMQTLPRSASDVTRLSSVISPQYSTLPQRQDTGVGTCFSFRRALDDHLRVHSPSSTTPTPTAAAEANDIDLEEFSDRCSIE